MWVRFTADFDWKPMPAVTIAYRDGMTLSVTTRCGAAAIDAGKAVRMRKRGKFSDTHQVVSENDSRPA